MRAVSKICPDNSPSRRARPLCHFSVAFIKWGMDIMGPLQPERADNGQEESSNKSILNIMKKKLEEAKVLWPEILPEVLCAHRTTPKMSTRDTPYYLDYGTEAVILVEVEEPSTRHSHKSITNKDESRRQDLDEVDERRDMAYISMVAQKQQAERYYNKKAKVQLLKIGDYVFKAKTQAKKDP
nr:uncharacterized protein LOC104118525 [Nicotiana tomentosiformis]